MKQIRFRREAERDLRGIIDYYEERAPETLPKITDDIYRSIDLLSEFPALGIKVPDRPFRRIVTRRYRFKVAYQVEDDFVSILGIFRYQDREA